MICVWCKRNIPEFLFFDGPMGADHLVLTPHPITIFRDDDFGTDEVKFSMHAYVKKELCSDVVDRVQLTPSLIWVSRSGDVLNFENNDLRSTEERLKEGG